MPAASRLWLKTGENRSSGWVNLCGCGWSGPGWRRSIDLTSSCGTARQYHGMVAVTSGGVCGAKRFFRKILSGGNRELRHWPAGLISSATGQKPHAMSAATMPLISGLQVWVLIPDEMGAVGVAGAVWSSESRGGPKQRPRSSEARARVKCRAAQWWCMSMVGRARAWLWQAGRRACEERAVRRHSWCPSKACRHDELAGPPGTG